MSVFGHGRGVDAILVEVFVPPPHFVHGARHCLLRVQGGGVGHLAGRAMRPVVRRRVRHARGTRVAVGGMRLGVVLGVLLRSGVEVGLRLVCVGVHRRARVAVGRGVVSRWRAHPRVVQLTPLLGQRLQDVGKHNTHTHTYTHTQARPCPCHSERTAELSAGKTRRKGSLEGPHCLTGNSKGKQTQNHNNDKDREGNTAREASAKLASRCSNSSCSRRSICRCSSRICAFSLPTCSASASALRASRADWSLFVAASEYVAATSSDRCFNVAASSVSWRFSRSKWSCTHFGLVAYMRTMQRYTCEERGPQYR